MHFLDAEKVLPIQLENPSLDPKGMSMWERTTRVNQT